MSMKYAMLCAGTMLLALPCVSQADTIVLTFPEVNGPLMVSGFPGPQTEIATDTFTIPVGQDVVSATLTGVFGQTSQYYGSTAEHDLLINNTQVGSTYDVTPDPYNNVVPFSFNVPSSLLQGGSADLSYIQESPYIVRLSSTTLTITTAASGVPEPGTYAMLGSLGLTGAAFLRRRRAR